MADGFSLPNAAELVEQLRSETHFVFGDYEGGFALPTQKELKAADAIESLLAENAKLKAERDVAVEEGEWKDENDFYGSHIAWRHKCGTVMNYKSRYCPGCGAKMIGGAK